MIELQEAKRQALKKRVEQARLDSDSEINWEDVADLTSAGTGSANPDVEIPPEVQDKLLSDYERELITEKLKKGEQKSLNEEIKSLNLDKKKPSTGNSSRNSPGSSQEKGNEKLFLFMRF